MESKKETMENEFKHKIEHKIEHGIERGIRLGIMFTIGAILFIGIGGFVVRALWNWLLPALFGLPQLTFWQALGILALSRILFGGFGLHGGGRHGFRRHKSKHWEHMTPEERERVKQGIEASTSEH